MKTAFVFPGQGAQYVGMATDFMEKEPEFAAVLSNFDSVHGTELARIMAEGPEDLLKETKYTQPAILFHSLCALKSFQIRSGLRPDFVAGHSLGEFSALVANGTLDWSDALHLVHKRGEFMIEANAGVALAGKRVLLIGAGGAAAGALGPLLEARPAVLVVANRTVAKAEELVARHADLAGGCALAARAPREAGERFDVVINATASSLQGAQVPVDSAVLAPGALALDMMYGPAAQGFIAWAEAHGARGRDGLGMLVEQAAEAFFLWRGVRPETAPVLAALRARLAAKVR